MVNLLNFLLMWQSHTPKGRPRQPPAAAVARDSLVPGSALPEGREVDKSPHSLWLILLFLSCWLNRWISKCEYQVQHSGLLYLVCMTVLLIYNARSRTDAMDSLSITISFPGIYSPSLLNTNHRRLPPTYVGITFPGTYPWQEFFYY